MLQKFCPIVILVFLCFLNAQSINLLCPKLCTCTNLFKRVDCRSKNLVRIPDLIPEIVEVLDLRHNAIQLLEMEKLSKYRKLSTLLISDNRIRHLNEVKKIKTFTYITSFNFVLKKINFFRLNKSKFIFLRIFLKEKYRSN